MGYWRNSSLFSIHFCIYLSFDGNVPFLHPNINVKRLLGEQEMLKIYYNWMGWVSKDDLISYVKSHESPTEKTLQCQLPLMVIWHFLMWITCVVITRWITCICHYSSLTRIIVKYFGNIKYKDLQIQILQLYFVSFRSWTHWAVLNGYWTRLSIINYYCSWSI